MKKFAVTLVISLLLQTITPMQAAAAEILETPYAPQTMEEVVLPDEAGREDVTRDSLAELSTSEETVHEESVDKAAQDTETGTDASMPGGTMETEVAEGGLAVENADDGMPEETDGEIAEDATREQENGFDSEEKSAGGTGAGEDGLDENLETGEEIGYEANVVDSFTNGSYTPDGASYTLAYRLNENTDGTKDIVIIGASGDMVGELILPEEIDGVPVTGIGYGAFSGCGGFDGRLVISENIMSIESFAFSRCSGFKGDLIIPASVTSIGQEAFSGCSGFDGSLIFHGNIESLGNKVFCDCSGLSKLVVKGDIAKTGYSLLDGCLNMNVIEIYSDMIQTEIWKVTPPSAGYGWPREIFIYSKDIDLSTASFSNRDIIYGYAGSTVEEYATQNELTFRLIDSSPEIEEYKVSTLEELEAAIGSYRHIIIADGIYGDAKYKGLSVGSDEETFINLTIEAEHPGKAEIIADPCEDVINIKSSYGLHIKGMILGHDSAGIGECGMDIPVISMHNVNNVRIEDCDFYGCGVWGIRSGETCNVNIDNCVFRDCTEGIFDGGNNYRLCFSDCIISGNAYSDVWKIDYEYNDNGWGPGHNYPVIFAMKGAKFIGCTFFNNYNTFFSEYDNIVTVNCQFYNNAWDDGTPESSGVCLNGITWQVDGKTLKLGYPLQFPGGATIQSASGKVLDYSDASLPWKKYEIEAVDSAAGVEYTERTYTVTFDVMGVGTAPASYTSVKKGSVITEPEKPTAEGYLFKGWYKDDKFAAAWDFVKDTVTDSITLYAKWEKDTTEEEIKKYTVTFDANGGSGPAEKTVTVEEGKKVEKPADPTREGYVFKGWYKDVGLATEWNFSTDTVTGDITLYAKWEGATAEETCTVAFNTNGGSAIESKKVKKGEKLEKPADPTKAGHVLEGWYADAAFTKEWKFDADAVTVDITLYAKWKENEIPEEPIDPTLKYYDVTYIMNDHGIQIPVQKVGEGRKIRKPAEPVAEGYTFLGWYKDVACRNAWDFAKDTVTASMKLYAGWKKDLENATDSGDAYYKDYQGSKKSLDAVGAKITGAKGKTYDGKPCSPAVKVAYKDGKKTITLIEGTDYTVSYEANVNAGAGKVTVTGCGAYTGTKTASFTIKPKSVKKLKVVVSGIKVNDKISDLPVNVYDGDLLLGENDYTLEYPESFTQSAGKKKLVVRGKGNYSSTTSKSVNVIVYEAEKALKAEEFWLDEDTYAYTGKAINPSVKSSLSSKYYTVKYSNNKNAGIGCVTITGKNGRTGSVVLNYRILSLGGTFHVNKDVPLKAITYNGKRLKPKVKVTAEVTINNTTKKKTLKAGRDYTVTYRNNLHATLGDSVAYVVITGKGNYENVGTKLVEFKINPVRLSKAKISGTEDNYVVKYGKRTLLAGADYTFVEYGKRSKGKVEVKLKGAGDFKGDFAKKVKEKQ